MASKHKFQFSKTDYAENYTFDKSLENFRQQIIDDGNSGNGNDAAGTIREIVQNSLDAKNSAVDGPVKLKISLAEIDRNQIPDVDEVFDHIDALKPGNDYTKEIVKYMKSKRDDQRITVLAAEDSNTKGLTGADSLDSGTYAIYAFNKGVHGKHEEASSEKVRGGSHGVGKIANNAASDIHLMYFANCDEFGNQHLGGSVQLFDHTIDGQSYRGTGHFADLNEANEFIPRRNEHDHPIFQKQSRGLKIIIPYLRPEMNNEESLIKAVLDNFFVAIIDERLEVSFKMNEKQIDINSASIDQVIEEYYPSDVSEMKKDFLPLYVHTYKHVEPEELILELPKTHKTDPFHFKLYFYDENEAIPAGRTAIVRSLGMKIEDKKIIGHATSPYNAVLIGGEREDAYMKTLENESHTELSHDAIRDPKQKRKAKAFINGIQKKLKEKIEDSQNQKIESDGEIDTSDLIYEMNWEFNEQISKNSEKVELSNGVNVIIDNQKEKRKPRKNSSPGKTSQGGGTKRKPRVKKPDPHNEREVYTYILPADVVSRALLRDGEKTFFNFKSIQGHESWKKINLSLKLVNGLGEELSGAVSLRELYTSVQEGKTGATDLSFDSEKIYDIPVTDGEVDLFFKTSQDYNPHLKFIYQVEVES